MDRCSKLPCVRNLRINHPRSWQWIIPCIHKLRVIQRRRTTICRVRRRRLHIFRNRNVWQEKIWAWLVSGLSTNQVDRLCLISDTWYSLRVSTHWWKYKIGVRRAVKHQHLPVIVIVTAIIPLKKWDSLHYQEHYTTYVLKRFLNIYLFWRFDS